MLSLVFILGFFLDWIEPTPNVLPLLALTLQTSFLTPPLDFALFYLKGVCPPEV